ncbi:hypothetical protein QZL74_22025 [Burkholderia gladioli pv. alliicola]|uniref:hypothetical protein n=1 Tax=Burkholderia gladioli TaxID=28095 RepID=UPI001FC7CD03|nr:hypothetical protein [Burkholderia gladioli]
MIEEGQLDEFELDAGKAATEFGDQRAMQLVEAAAQEAEAQLARLAGRRAPAIGEGGLERHVGGLGAFAQCLAERRERHAAAGAIEQRGADGFLQRADRFRYG